MIGTGAGGGPVAAVLAEAGLDVLVLEAGPRVSSDDFTGDVMSDLNTRRARIQGMEAEGANQKIVATAPEVELLRYSTQLRSLTQGRGLHTATFKQYEPMPRNVQDQIVAEAKKAKEDDE